MISLQPWARTALKNIAAVPLAAVLVLGLLTEVERAGVPESKIFNRVWYGGEHVIYGEVARGGVAFIVLLDDSCQHRTYEPLGTLVIKGL